MPVQKVYLSFSSLVTRNKFWLYFETKDYETESIYLNGL